MICNVCNKRRAKTGSKGTETSPHSDMCNYCWEEGGWENTHNDADHKSINLAELTEEQAIEVQGCWFCYPELNLAQKPAKAGISGSKKQGDRRPQLNHKGHSHPATPAARRECKKAFWAEYAKSGITPANISATPFLEWDFSCDGHGKPVKAAQWNVAPLGPKGGVGHSMKVAASKASK